MDDLSSAHVYLRLPEGTGMDDIPEYTLEDCCQLVKQNSIQGARRQRRAAAAAGKHGCVVAGGRVRGCGSSTT